MRENKKKKKNELSSHDGKEGIKMHVTQRRKEVEGKQRKKKRINQRKERKTQTKRRNATILKRFTDMYVSLWNKIPAAATVISLKRK